MQSECRLPGSQLFAVLPNGHRRHRQGHKLFMAAFSGPQSDA